MIITIIIILFNKFLRQPINEYIVSLYYFFKLMESLMKKNLFDMGANFEDTWTSDNKEKARKKVILEIKAPQKHQLHFAKEKRRGKVVSIVKPFYLSSNDLKALLKTLKKNLGTGGTVKDESLEFQGEVQEKLRIQLEKQGYGFKK